jgi:peptidoglycan/LPS O-acetylase OafA/YrhL
MNHSDLSVTCVSTYPERVVDDRPLTVGEPIAVDQDEPAWLSRGQIPSLHGLRALSILLVLIAHLAQHGILLPRTWHLTELGRLGVDMFFVISGFLITVLLLREQKKQQTISLKQFYLRRAFRILPAYLCFLLGIALMNSLGVVALSGWDWFAVLTYTVSFVPKPTWDIGHIWSLSVEEHFYLLWPIVMLCWPRRGWLVPLATIVTTPLMRWLIQEHIPTLDASYCTLTRMDTIAVGCGLAYLAYWPRFRRVLRLSARSAYLFSAVLVLLVGLSQLAALRVPMYQLALHPLLVASAYATTIWLWTQHSRSHLGRLLNSKPAVWIGLLSYSLYLWQQPFLNPHGNAWFAQSPLNLVCIPVLAIASYLLVERPLVQWKDHWSRQRSHHDNITATASAPLT